MGLDIHITVDNQEEVYDAVYFDEQADNFHQHQLSRTFCNLMCRRDVVNGEPELDQIGKITGIDVSPIYDMNDYGDEDSITWLLDSADTAAERAERLKTIQANRDKLKGNIDKITLLIADLLNKLSGIHHLSEQLILDAEDHDALNNAVYFANFNANPGDGYINNNFGQDLRNFKKFLLYAKNKGTQTVYFNYG
ncbi:MAG: hypothetical protein V4592_01410 [Bacteroidota bacterium]